MSPERQRRSLIAFFLGSTAAKLEVTDPKLVRIVSRRAYRDLSRTLHGFGTHPESGSLLEDTHHSLAGFITQVEEISSEKAFDELHDQWCRDIVQRFGEAPHPERELVFRYGQAQKWLNMTTKYFAVLGHPSLANVYPHLHVPIDSIIYRQASHIGVPTPSAAWSRLDRSQYLEYQHELRKKIRETCGESYAPLDWETDVWIQRGD